MYPCHFIGVSEREVTLEIDPNDQPVHFVPGSPACVLFNTGGRAHVFLVNVRRFRPNVGPLIILEVPSKVATADNRISHRVPVSKDSALEVSMQPSKGPKLKAKAFDISMTGLGVALPVAPPIKLGDAFKITLRYRDHTVELNGTICWRQAEVFGIFFPDCSVNGFVKPPSVLRAIVQQLEQEHRHGRLEPGLNGSSREL